MSNFNINGFRSGGLGFDGARPTQFVVHMNFPTIASNGTTETQKLAFLAQSTELPSSQLGVVEVPYFGRTIKLDGDRTFPDWSIDVLNDEDFRIRAAFEAWMNGINTHISNRKDSSFSGLNYKSSATVYQLSKNAQSPEIENAIRAYTFSGLFPTNLEAIRLDWSRINAIETFGVTFAYDYWIPGADESASESSSFNGIDGSAKAWNPRLPSDTV